MLQFTRLRIVGFKSFVEPAELPIEPGLTGIVGPNGCGKSNLVEALRWAMGESSAKALRGGEMEDVIFGGAAGRPARSLAEVVIGLDNSERLAPPPFADDAELQVSRRIERARGSLYRINGREVRARDVQLLFADQSSGARSAAMVTQGQVSALITAKPSDRRAVLEEAAGITGLATRRREAESRLAAADDNLHRVEDILVTLARQQENLRQQAEQAVRYRQLSAEIRQAEAALLWRQWQAVAAALDKAEAGLRAAEHDVATMTGAAAEAAARQTAAAAVLPAVREADGEAAAQLHRLARAGDGLDAEAARCETETAAARRQEEEVQADLRRAEAIARDGSDAIARLTAERQRLDEARAGEERQGAAAAAAVAEQASAVAEAEGRLQAAQQRLAAVEANRTSLRATAEGLRTRLQRLCTQAEDLQRQRQTLNAEGTADLDGLQDDEQRAAAAVATAIEEHERAEAEHAALSAALAEAVAAAHAGETVVARLEAEERTLARLLTAGDATMERPVIDAVSVEAGFEAAFAAALGDDVLASLDPAAAFHWRELAPLSDLPPLPEGLPTLAAHVGAPPALARRLLSVGIVDDAAEAERLLAGLRPGQRLVSRDGRLWRWDGLVRDAAVASAAAVRLEQHNRLRAVCGELTATRRQSGEAAAVARDAKQRLAVATAAVGAAKAAVRTQDAGLSRLREHLSRARARNADLHARQTALAARAEAVAEETREAKGAAETAAADYARLPDPQAERAAVETVRHELDGLRATLLDRRTRLATLEREAVGRRRRQETLSREIADWQRRADEAAGQLQQLRNRRGNIAAERARLAEVPAALARRRAEWLEEQKAAEQARRLSGDALAVAEETLRAEDGRLRAAEVSLARARETLLRAEAGVATAGQERAAVSQRIDERLAVGAEELAAMVASGAVGEKVADERRLERMRRERDLIGPVNLRAEEESAALAAQTATLSGQRDDLTAAIAKLRRAIGEIDAESRQRLQAAFAAIDRHFRTLFLRLFGGGRAQLLLTEAEDPLDAGLEILASPPGKRLQSLSLLSGGEQALTALALRFAVFLTRPAPICVLDEVDAPLDDANVDRFCRLLEEMAASGTRFLVITHHRMTMARMDRLFGVTMLEKGVSQLVSVDLRGAEDLRQRA